MKLIDLFTYITLGGQRKLKMYVKFTLGILVTISLIFTYSQWTQAQSMAEIQATAIPIQGTKVPTMEVSPTEIRATDTATVESCPSDPAQWELQDVKPGDNLKKISPSCVYDGLGRTVAWAIMVNMGYLPGDANQKLGFSQSPAVNPGKLNIMTNTKGPLEISLSAQPTDAQYTQWVVNANAQSGIVFALRGCFRTQTITGDKADNWGNGYFVICEVGQDYVNTYLLMSHSGDYFTEGQAGSVRLFSMFGYDGKQWFWLGQKQDLDVQTDPETVTNEIKFYSTPYGAPIWDSQWLLRTYNIQLKPLPANWLSYTEATSRDNILKKLNSSQGGSVP
jgi:hypothetical protein